MTALHERGQLDRGQKYKLVRLDNAFGISLATGEKRLQHANIADQDGLLRNPDHSRDEPPIISDGAGIYWASPTLLAMDDSVTISCIIEGASNLELNALIRVRRETAQLLANALHIDVQANLPERGKELFHPQ